MRSPPAVTRGAPGPLSELARAASWHRRLLAGGLAAGSVALGLQALEPSPPPTVQVLASAVDLPGGALLRTEDLVSIALPEGAVPHGALLAREDAVGALLAGPVRAGEALTDVRVLGAGLLQGWGEDRVASPVRVADAEAVALVRPGDRVDLLATATTGEGASRVVAADVPVLATPQPGELPALSEGALLVVASTRGQAAELAAAAVTSRLSLTLRPTPVANRDVPATQGH